MNKKEAFQMLDRLAGGIAKTFGGNCETIIHDLNNREHSVVAIYNGHVTGRRLGDRLNLLGTDTPIGDLLIGESDLINTEGRTVDGKLIKSSTFQFVGKDYHYGLGINFDCTMLSAAESAIRDLIAVGEPMVDAMSETADHRLESILQDCLKQIGKPLSLMKKDDRIRLVTLLQERNAFSFQKSIPFISEQLNISRYTIYNYLKIINREHQDESRIPL
jgi:predicted transcriptional regulator YheO